MRILYLVLRILPALFFVCLEQGDSYAWFHSSGNFNSCPVFEQPRSPEHVSKTYAFLPNAPNEGSGVRLYGTFSKDSSPASAGELKIDIPFNLLSASTTNVQALLDRQVAANLRLKNLLDQYIARQKKNAAMLKDLSIPYLEVKETQKKAVPAADEKKLPETDKLKKKIAEEILFQAGGKDRTALQDNRNFQSVPTSNGSRGNSVSNLEKDERVNLSENHSKNQRGIGAYHETYGRDTELPWIFSFGLNLLRSLASNKFEIFSWAAVMAVIGLVGTIVVKK